MSEIVNAAYELIAKCRTENELNQVKSVFDKIFRDLNKQLWSKK